jgi:hypothetical protein
MSVIFMEGFALYPGNVGLNLVSGTNWSTTGNTCIVLTSGRFTNRSLGFSPSGSTAGGNFYTISQTASSHYWINWSQRQLLTRDSNRYNHGLRTRHGGGTVQDIAIILDSDLKAKLYYETVLLAETTNTFAIGEWVDMRMRVNVLNGEIVWYVNDTEVFNGFTGGFSGAQLTAVYVGNVFCPPNGGVISTGGFAVDDIIVSLDGPDLGRTGVLYLFPDADETEQDFTPNSGSDGFAMIDAPLQDGTVTQYIEGTTVGDISKFDIEAPGVSVFGLYAVQIQSYQIKTTTATTEVDLILTVNGADYNSPAIALSNTQYVLQDYIWDLNPDTAAQWQTTDIPGLRLGIEKVT